MKIVVLGAGAWGTALAVAAARAVPPMHARAHVAMMPATPALKAVPDLQQQEQPAHGVTLWARDAAQTAAMQTRRENVRYLPGIALPPSLLLRADPVTALAALVVDADLVIVATPMVGLRGMLHHIRDCQAPVAWLCKGFEPLGNSLADAATHAFKNSPAYSGAMSRALTDNDATIHENAIPIVVSGAFGLLAHEVQAQEAPDLIAGVLSGPSFAMEVARGQPTALVASSMHPSVRDTLVRAFHSPSLRVYANDDIVGVEVGGAVKNVLAIATGLCDGLNLGLNARAALITRGLAEMTRLGLALGAKAETFMGLSGLGDLVLTATGDLSRNRKIGLLLAQGKTLRQSIDSLGHVAEGVHCARAVLQRAQSLGVDMPISSAVVALLDGRINAVQAVAALMGREAREEA